VNANLFINSSTVLSQNWELILAVLALVFWGTVLIFAVLKKTTKQSFTDMELMTLALGGWPAPALLISLFMLLFRIFIPDEILFIVVITFVIVSAGVAIRAVWRHVSVDLILIPIIFFIFIFIRLGFIADVILPSYFDSAEHYRIIQFFLDRHLWPTTSYYHVGYHVIAAALVSITRAGIGQVMLVFGQIVLAAIPFPIYFFIQRVTGLRAAAFFGVVLAAFGWFMPAHAINWGKYPALLSLLLIQFALGMAVIKNRWMLALFFLVSILVHTRAIILFAMIGVTWNLSGRILNKRIMLFALAGAMLGMAALLINRDQAIAPTLEPYRIWVTLLVGLLAVSVSRSYPRLILFSTLAMLGILAMSFVPVSILYTLLDRPLVEMILFLPLAFLGGLGAARLPKFAVMLLAVFIIFHALTTYNFSPSDCCQLANRDDAAALDWMDRRLPADALIAIASADLNIDAYSAPMQGTGTDAGIWVAPLTGRAVFSLPYVTDFITQDTHDILCQNHVTHIYIGARLQSFSSDTLKENPEWYQTVFQLPNARIAQVQGCGNK
jgi:hypothetical protein